MNDGTIDAYAVCHEPDGSERWALRIGIPGASNAFRLTGILPDGRLLLQFQTDSDSFGSKWYIVGRDGFIEEMLNERELLGTIMPSTFALLPQGYLGDGAEYWNEYYNRYFKNPESPRYTPDNRRITLLDFALEPVWELDKVALFEDSMSCDVLGMEDATLLYGSVWKQEDPQTSHATAVLVDPAGKVLWQYVMADVAQALSGFHDAIAVEDGFILCGEIRHDIGWPFGDLFLWKLTMDGELKQLIDISDLWDLASGVKMASLADGIAILFYSHTMDRYLFYLEPDGAVRGTLPLFSVREEETDVAHYNDICELVLGEDGHLYQYGMLMECTVDWENVKPLAFYYTLLTPETFR